MVKKHIQLTSEKIMLQPKQQTKISEEEYLNGELISEIRHKYIDDYDYAMTGASKNHQRITLNVSRQFVNFLENSPCEPFSTGIKVKVGSQYFYPVVMVACENDYYTQTPTIIIEVLSRSTRRMDDTVKKIAYQNIPTFQEYVLIEHDFVDIEICRRSEGWISKHFFMGDQMTFESLDVTISVEDIYQRVNNEDVHAYHTEQQR